MKQIYELPLGRNLNVFFSCLHHVMKVVDNMNQPLESNNMLLMDVEGPIFQLQFILITSYCLCAKEYMT